MPKKKKPAGAPKHFRYRRTKKQIIIDEANKKRYKIRVKETEEIAKGQEFERTYAGYKQVKFPTVQRIEQALYRIVTQKNGLFVHPYLLKTFGDNRIACVMSFFLVLEYNLATEKNPEFIAKYKHIEIMVGIKHNVVQRCINALREAGVVTTELKGMPARLHYTIDKDVLMDLIYASVQPRGYKDIDKEAFPEYSFPEAKEIKL